LTFSILADIGSVISGIGALFASIAALVTVREMKKQREDSIRPELILSEEKYSVKYSKNEDLPIFLTVKEGLQTPLYINIKNIGVGPAKKISMTWDFDFQNYVELLYYEGKYHRYLESHSENQFKTLKHGYFSVEDLNNYSISILGEKKKVPLDLPPSYVQMLSIIINEHYISQKIRKLPELRLKLKYFDSHWKEAKDTIAIEPLLRSSNREHFFGEINYEATLLFRIKDKYSPTS
jgi:hypothetical protein